jgi:hypothetical protein
LNITTTAKNPQTKTTMIGYNIYASINEDGRLWILLLFLYYLSSKTYNMFCKSSSQTVRWSKYKEFFLLQEIDLNFEDYKHGLLTGDSANIVKLKNELKSSTNYEIFVKYSCPSSLVFYEFVGFCFAINVILGISHLTYKIYSVETGISNDKVGKNYYDFWDLIQGLFICFFLYLGFYISYTVRYNLQCSLKKEKQKLDWRNFKAYYSKTYDYIAKEFKKDGFLHAVLYVCYSSWRFSWILGAFFFNLILSLTFWNCMNLKDEIRWFFKFNSIQDFLLLLSIILWLLPSLHFCMHQISYRICNYMELLKWINAKLNSSMVYVLVFLLIMFSLHDNWTHFLEKSCSRNCSFLMNGKIKLQLSAQEISFCKNLEDIREEEKGFLYKFFFKYAIQYLKEGFNVLFTSSGNEKNFNDGSGKLDNFCEMHGNIYILSNGTEAMKGEFFSRAYSTNQLAMLMEGICLVILNTFIDLSKIFEDYGWMVSVVIQWLRVEISSHFMKYEQNLIISWNIFVYSRDNDKKMLKIINEGSVSLNDMLNHDPKLLEVVVKAANKTTEDSPFLVLDLDNQINFSRNLITKVSELLSSSNWPVYAMNNVEDRKRINEDVLIIVTCEKDTQFKHTRAWLVFPSELEMLKNATYEEINNTGEDRKFEVAKPNHRVRISNLKKWADSYFNKDDKDHEDIKKSTQTIVLPCQNNNSSHTHPNSISNTPSNSFIKDVYETKSNQSSPRLALTNTFGAPPNSSRRNSNSAAQGASSGSTAKISKIKWSDDSESTASPYSESPRSISSPRSSNAPNASDNPQSCNPQSWKIALKRTKSPSKQASKHDEKSSTPYEEDPDLRFFGDDKVNIKKSSTSNSSPVRLNDNGGVNNVASKRTCSPGKRSL